MFLITGISVFDTDIVPHQVPASYLVLRQQSRTVHSLIAESLFCHGGWGLIQLLLIVWLGRSSAQRDWPQEWLRHPWVNSSRSVPAVTARFRGFPTVTVVSHLGVMPKPFGSLGTASPVFGNEAQGTWRWHFQAVFQLSGGNNWTFALTVPAVWLRAQTEMQS